MMYPQDPTNQQGPRPRTFTWRIQLGLLSPNPSEWAQQLEMQQAAFANLVQQYPYPEMEQTPDDDDDDLDTPPDDDLDPLTAMWMQDQKQTDRLQALDKQYRKERARRKRGLAGSAQYQEEPVDATEQQAIALQIIDKDLARLPTPTNTAVISDVRLSMLRQVLFVWNCTASVGYQQGMHEIASYILYALELEGILSDPQATADTYHMLRVMLLQLLPAYDVVVDDNNGGGASPRTKPLEQASRRILEQLSRQDPTLYQTLVSSCLASVPPQLVFTKWIRLLFSREVTHVLELWDCMMEQVGQGFTLQQVAEALAVARLLVHRSVLLEQHAAGTSASDMLHYLMNMPIEQTIRPLTELLVPLLQGQSVTALLPPAPPPPTSPSRLPESTSSMMDPLTQALQSITMTNHTTTPTVTPGLRFSLSSVKDKIAIQTQSISKRLYQEWEQHVVVPPNEERNYDDPPPRVVQPEQANDPYRAMIWSSHDTAVATPLPQQYASQMQTPLNVLQEFAMQMQGQQQRVPDQVWEALASLEVIRTQLGQYNPS